MVNMKPITPLLSHLDLLLYPLPLINIQNTRLEPRNVKERKKLEYAQIKPSNIKEKEVILTHRGKEYIGIGLN